MVAYVNAGKSLASILRYNERKVSKGIAKLVGEEKFGCDPNTLTFSQKLQRFKMLTRRNKKVKTNAVHITLNFVRDDLVEPNQLQEIVKVYMQGIGLGSQPYLLYEHFDTAHPHVHLITTNVREGGKAINLHMIGKEKSEPMCRTIEHEFGLIPAQRIKSESKYELKPVNLGRVFYGQVETKAAIASVVNEVVRRYRFSNIGQMRAVLEQFGVTVNGGKPGSRLFERRGLMYSMLNESGQRVGTPIKASDIHFKPTLNKLEKKFATDVIGRQAYSQVLKFTLDQVMSGTFRPADEHGFAVALAEKQITVQYQRNQVNEVTGLIYVDNRTRVVFDGHELGEPYSFSGVQMRMKSLPQEELHNEEKFVNRVLANTDFSQTLPKVLSAWAAQDMLVHVQENSKSGPIYFLYHRKSSVFDQVKANEHLARWLRVNKVTASQCKLLRNRLDEILPVSIQNGLPEMKERITDVVKIVSSIVGQIVEEIFRLAPGRNYIPYQLLHSAHIKRHTKKRGHGLN